MTDDTEQKINELLRQNIEVMERMDVLLRMQWENLNPRLIRLEKRLNAMTNGLYRLN